MEWCSQDCVGSEHSQTVSKRRALLSDLSSHFNIKDLGEAELYLACQIMRNREARTLTFDQHIYAETVARPLNVTKTSMIPMATLVKPLSREGDSKTPKKGKKCSASHTGGSGGPDVGGDHDNTRSFVPRKT